MRLHKGRPGLEVKIPNAFQQHGARHRLAGMTHQELQQLEFLLLQLDDGFAAPDDPVFEARLEAVRRSGGNPFRDEQLPQAVIALKQAVGRLIRTESDRGVLVLCDPRLTGKSYGRVFMGSLPDFTVTRSLQEVQAFFARA